MRKSPLSAPCGSNGKRNYDTNNTPSPHRHNGYNGTSYYDKYRIGDVNTNDCLGNSLSEFKDKNIQYFNEKNSDGFIPLGYSSSMNQHQYQHQYQNKNQNQWRGSGGWHVRRGTNSTNNSGYNNQRNNSYNNTPNSSYNDSNSPSYFKKQNFANRRPRQKDAHRRVDIGSYVNARSMLEDPWADLIKKFEYENSKNLINDEENNLREDFIKETEKTNSDIGIDRSGNENLDLSNDSGEILDSKIESDNS